MVRLEAVRAWTRRGVKDHGCQPLLDALNDQSMHVVLAALDALGDVCRDDGAITARLASEARTPRPQGPWQREAHAFVALAKRDRERAAISMLTFAMHTTWQVRMYAARAAAIVDDVAVLTRLASDAEDNVAEAALTPLRRLIGAESDRAVHRRPEPADANRSSEAPCARTKSSARRRWRSTRRDADTGARRRARRRPRTHQRRTLRDVARHAARAHRPSGPARLAAQVVDADAAPQGHRSRRSRSAAADVITQWTGKVVGDRHAAPEVRPTYRRPRTLADRVRVSFEMDSGRRSTSSSMLVGGAAGAHAVPGGRADRLLQRPDVPSRRAELRHSGRQPGRQRVLRRLPLHARRSGPRCTNAAPSASRLAGPTPATRRSSSTSSITPAWTSTTRCSAASARGMTVVDEISGRRSHRPGQILPPTDNCGG